MANTKKIVQVALIGLGAATAGSVLAKGLVNAAYNNISYEFVEANFNFNQLIQGRLGVDIKIKIINHNSVGATVTNVVGTVHYGGIKVADVNTPLAITIPANGQGVGTINLSIQAMSLVNDVLAAFQPGSNLYTTLVNKLKFKGIIYTNVVNVPIEMNIPIVVG